MGNEGSSRRGARGGRAGGGEGKEVKDDGKAADSTASTASVDEKDVDDGAPMPDVDVGPLGQSKGRTVGMDDFDLLKVLGKGSFGKVMLVRHKETGEIGALKTLRKQNLLKRNQIMHTRAERSILQTVDHPFIVKLRYAFQTRDKLCVRAGAYAYAFPVWAPHSTYANPYASRDCVTGTL